MFTHLHYLCKKLQYFNTAEENIPAEDKPEYNLSSVTFFIIISIQNKWLHLFLRFNQMWWNEMKNRCAVSL